MKCFVIEPSVDRERNRLVFRTHEAMNIIITEFLLTHHRKVQRTDYLYESGLLA